MQVLQDEEEPREKTNCFCPVHIQGWIGETYYNKVNLKTNNWDEAAYKIREMQAAQFLPFPEGEKKERVTIKDAAARYVKEGESRNVAEATIGKLRVLLEKQLIPFAEKSGFFYLDECSLDFLRDFRASWKDAPAAQIVFFGSASIPATSP